MKTGDGATHREFESHTLRQKKTHALIQSMGLFQRNKSLPEFVKYAAACEGIYFISLDVKYQISHPKDISLHIPPFWLYNRFSKRNLMILEVLCLDRTSCHSYFAICSAGTIQNKIGFVAAENSCFDPDYITEKLGIEPFETHKMDTPRKNGHGHYPFSDWACCKQCEPSLDAEEQCRKIVRELHELIPQLQEIKKEYNVDYSIIIVPHIYNEEHPILGFDSEIIEFCYLTGTEIAVDMYVYDKK